MLLTPSLILGIPYINWIPPWETYITFSTNPCMVGRIENTGDLIHGTYTNSYILLTGIMEDKQIFTCCYFHALDLGVAED